MVLLQVQAQHQVLAVEFLNPIVVVSQLVQLASVRDSGSITLALFELLV